MPTPRYNGGAPLEHYPLNVPSYKGLNKQAQGAVLGPEWATRMENTVLDASNRVAARNGWAKRTTLTATTGNIVQMLTAIISAQEQIIVTTDDDKLWASSNGGDSFTDVTGTASVVDPNMQLVIFNDTVLGFQQGGSPVTYNGTSFSNLGATGEPSGYSVALSAFGRLWVKDSPTSFAYCGLLNENDWTSQDTGGFDLTSVWQGQDEISALSEFNGALVAFSRRNIITYTDGQGSALALDPVTAYISDTVGGIGCIARDTVVNVKGDLWFLDDTGLHNLGRLISERSNPIDNISRNVQDELKKYTDITDPANMRAIYSPGDRFYLLSLPLGSGSTENGVVFCFDTRGMLEDGSYRCTGIWNQMVPTAMAIEDNNLDLLMSLRVKSGEIGAYEGYLDELSTYVLEYESGWTNLGNANLKMVKRLTGLLYVQAATIVTYKWAFDFVEEFKTAQTVYPGSGGAAEWGSAEWNIDEWGGGVNLREKQVGGKGTGEYIKIGMTIDIDGDEVSCQQLNLYAKNGRLK